MTITEKILAAHCGKEKVRPGELVDVHLDLILANDVSAPLAIRNLREAGVDRLFDPSRVCLALDHFVPNSTVDAAEKSKYVRNFAREYGVENLFDAGRMGIEHALLPELGMVRPGQVVVGGDSHTCTYGALGAFSTGMGSTDIAAAMASGVLWMKVPPSIRLRYNGTLPPYVTGKDLILHTIGIIGVDGAIYQAMEFCGDAIDHLSMDGRFTICNMAVEAGAKNGVIAPDHTTMEFLAAHGNGRTANVLTSDPDAEYVQEYVFDVSALRPQVALPHLPSNVRSIEDVAGTPVDQVVIGSCTNGRMEDLRAAAQVLKGRQVHPRIRTIIIPATQRIYKQAIAEGLVEIFIDAGAAVSTPTCGPCFGGHMGLLAQGERAVSTTNRNFVGRMGHKQSEVYLAGPYVAAATAVAGVIAEPEEAL